MSSFSIFSHEIHPNWSMSCFYRRKSGEKQRRQKCEVGVGDSKDAALHIVVFLSRAVEKLKEHRLAS